MLDDLGIPIIEAGNPTSNPRELEFFERASRLWLKKFPPVRIRFNAEKGRESRRGRGVRRSAQGGNPRAFQ